MTYKIEHAAVIGAGTMGAAIAAHLANAGVRSLLLDVVPSELSPDEEARGLSLKDKGVRNRIVRESWERCRTARPANLFSERRANLVTLGNIEDDLDRVSEADWIIEAVVERLDIKHEIMSRIEAARKPDSIVSTNTSGLPIHKISEGRSADFKAHFLGTHFFNPPRYLKLLEVIPGEETKPEILEFIVEFAAERLGKGVIVSKDTPNFIGNRYFSIVNTYTLDYALENGYTVEEVDRLTGPLIGYPKTATYRLLDLVGIDVMGHVRDHLYPALEGDEFREVLQSTRVKAMVEGIVERGWLGRKTGQGFYKRVADGDFWWLDIDSMEYQPPAKPKFESVGKHKDEEHLGERLRLIVAEEDRAAQFLWATTSFGLRYAASLIPSVSESLLSIDNAMKWGFMHEAGPFERWDALGVRESVARIESEGETVADWVSEMLEAGVESFYQRENGRVIGYYDPVSRSYVRIPPDPRVISIPDLKARSRELHANDGASLLDMGDGVLLLEFHTPSSNALDADLLQMADVALEELEKDEWNAMVVGNQGKHFSVGANIFAMAVAAQQGDMSLVEEGVRALQSILQRMRAHRKPIVVAPFGMALGGGAEVVMAGSRVVAAAESYIGLVEVGVGLIPAGSGTKELMRRRLGPVMRIENADVLPHLQAIFEQIALAKVSESAEQAREMGFLTEADRIVMNPDYLLAEAKRTALQMSEAGYQPVQDGQVWAAGRDALADLKMLVWSMVDAGYATEYDGVVANHLAYVMTGGEISGPGWVPDEYILDLEREEFVALAAEPKTQERMWYMLQNRRPLRN
ncbi:MAG: 3-hydroxyacyl-CoA dehydrogenase/enoyl-CoA hydratase family protein [Anaerolineae bacterium]|nr:MAG: 3-hydroxyacyl-CoA dehydrogenase/enoyl-CoA hydratase family protein [Anaerolineae bacterium]